MGDGAAREAEFAGLSLLPSNGRILRVSNQAKKAKPKLPLKIRAQLALAALMEVLYSARSEERDERRMARLFLVSSALSLFVAIAGGMAVALMRGFAGGNSDAYLDPDRERLARLAEIERSRVEPYTLGYFEIELNPRKEDGTLEIAEFELVAQCLQREACDFLERNPDIIRSEIGAVLVPMPRDEVLSRDGKEKIKKTILQRLNALIPLSQLEGVYFTHFRVE
jgi:flagellar basal body-associated protein FliL